MSYPFSSCFHPPPTTDDNHYLPPPPPSTNPNLTTYLYYTDIGLVSLTWSRSVLGHSLHVNLHNHPFDSPPFSTLSSLHLHIKPFVFWKKHGTKKLSHNTNLFWNLSRAKFGSGPEPKSGFYIAVVVDNEMTLLIGDSKRDAYAKSKAFEPKNSQFLVLKREHVLANKIYNTRARFGGRMREIQIDCGGDSSTLCFSVDGENVLQIKQLKWKFRGNERVEIDGVPVQISWDVYNWLFEKDNSDGHAIFMLKFEEEDEEERGDKSSMNTWMQQNWNMGSYEWGKMRSNSSVSMTSSAGSYGGSSSVLEWCSVEENELVVPIGFSLLVYAWKR
ncbi:hypothetical protein Lal_00002487 [Lupinus albus]|uniref:Uncharacterized protein n=1 Tax=Lupinus albus TaxID=3870 RepID=A0A6A5P8L9_LUPAL|nr:hypothetical protein Lalb_Chr11g0063561 [Lupinus albus]KAF1893935.1 hypothetical protein Lal_00002487 [Lupinus albus]